MLGGKRRPLGGHEEDDLQVARRILVRLCTVIPLNGPNCYVPMISWYLELWQDDHEDEQDR